MAQSPREATRGRLRSMVDSLYLSCLQVRRPSHGPHVSRKRVAVIRSFEYSGLIQSREVGVLQYILLDLTLQIDSLTTLGINPDDIFTEKISGAKGASLVVRDYDGNSAVAPPTGLLPIIVDVHLAMNVTGTLHLVFDADPWDSTISFAPGIPIARGGMLDLTFDAGVNAATQIGRTIDLFDWTGVTPSGTFVVSSPHTWDLSKLYTTGEVTLAAAPGFSGDFNGNGVVDAADYVVWRKNHGTATAYDTWRTHFGEPSGNRAALHSTGPASTAVPEP